MLLGDLKTAWGGKKVNNFLSPKIIYFFWCFVLFLPQFSPVLGPQTSPQLSPNPSQNPKKTGGFGGVLGRGVQTKNSGQILAKQNFWKKVWRGSGGVCPEKKFWKNSGNFQNFCPEKNSGNFLRQKNSGNFQNFFLEKNSGNFQNFSRIFFWTPPPKGPSKIFFWTKILDKSRICPDFLVWTPLPR